MRLKSFILSFLFFCLIAAGGAYYWVGFARPAMGNSMDFPLETTKINVIPVMENLSHPWAVEFLPNGDFLITERSGNLVYGTAAGDRSDISGLPDNIYAEGQGGLLDVVQSPDFENDRMIYFSYAAVDDEGNANTEVAKAVLNVEDKRLENVNVIFRALPKVEGGNHFGSRILFDNNNHVYITLGERFDYSEDAQNITNHIGTLIRVNTDGSIPRDNPFVDHENAKSEIFSYGHRNAQGIALHPETGEVWLHEHGPRGGDEINIIKPGANYGWPKVSHGVHYSGLPVSDSPTGEGFTDPYLQWTPSIAPSGMIFYQGTAFPEWQGDLLIGALAKKHLRRVVLDNGKVKDQTIMLNDLNKRIRDVTVSPQGDLYVLTDENNGGLYRIDPADKN